MTNPTIAAGVYEHYKGKKYYVLGLSMDSETQQIYVVYRPLYESDWPHLFHRSLSMFCENVDVDGKSMPRFRLIAA